jgi:two-component system, NarL family, sensor kinase
VQVPLAWRLAGRLRRSQRDREALLVRAVDASNDERRRIAGDLHDGVVQGLAGISYSLSAAADKADVQTPPEIRDTLDEAAVGTRDSMRRIRSMLVEIHPPNLRAAGLEAALTDLVAPFPVRGIDVELDVDGDLDLPADTEQLVYRAAHEALRNVEKHADASSVRVRLARRTDDVVRLEITDDGSGFTPEERASRRADGHVGLSLIEDLAERMDGRLDVQGIPGSGTRFLLEVPA